MRRILLRILPHSRPIPTTIYTPANISNVYPLSVDVERVCGFERRICVAEDNLAHVLNTMFNMARPIDAIGSVAGAQKVETMQLVKHRDQEGAVIGAEINKASSVWKLRPPVLVRMQTKMGIVSR